MKQIVLILFLFISACKNEIVSVTCSTDKYKVIEYKARTGPALYVSVQMPYGIELFNINSKSVPMDSVQIERCFYKNGGKRSSPYMKMRLIQ